jgi:hypothetical protein
MAVIEIDALITWQNVMRIIEKQSQVWRSQMLRFEVIFFLQNFINLT